MSSAHGLNYPSLSSLTKSGDQYECESLAAFVYKY